LKVIHFVLAIVLLTPTATFAKFLKVIPTPHLPRPHLPHKTKQESSTSKTKEESTEKPASAEEGTGPTAYVQVQAGGNRQGIVSSVDVNLGYNLTNHFGADIGLPIFYVRSPLSLVTSTDWKTDTLLGDPYIDIRYKLVRSGISVTSVLTGSVPASSPERVYTTGRVGVDWFNHIEPTKPIMRLSPFVNLGVANSTINRYYMPRPYSTGRPYETFGLMGDGEAGININLPYGFRIGASGYGLLPSGNQKVFSRLVTPGSSVVGVFANNRYYFSAFETTGPQSIDRDNGYSGWIEYGNPRKVVIQAGYTHSNHYRYNMITLSLNFNGTSLIRTITGKTE
jgi:hypothetical protein